MLPFESLKPVFYPQISKLPLSLQTLLFSLQICFPSKTSVFPPILLFSLQNCYFPSKTSVFPPKLSFSLQNCHFPSKTSVFPPKLSFSLQNCHFPSKTSVFPPKLTVPDKNNHEQCHPLQIHPQVRILVCPHAPCPLPYPYALKLSPPLPLCPKLSPPPVPALSNRPFTLKSAPRSVFYSVPSPSVPSLQIPAL